MVAGRAPERVLVFRALQLGDLLCAVPALRALRRALPSSEITLVSLPWAPEFVARFGAYVDVLLEFPGYPGLPERNTRSADVLAFLRNVQGNEYDLAIQMHGSGAVTNPLVALFGARATAGCYLPGQFCPDPERFLPYPAHEREARRCLELATFLGAPDAGEDLEFPLLPGDRDEFETLARQHGLEGGAYVCIHPGARHPSRRWAAADFAVVGDALAGRGLRVAITGSKDEAAITHSVRQQMKAPAVDLAGQTSLGALAALVEGARLVVSNDTGVAHLADALRTPSVTVFMASDPERWAAADGRLHRAVVAAGAETNHCRHAGISGEHRCLRDGCHFPPPAAERKTEGVLPQVVVHEALSLLEKETAHA